MGVVRRVGRDAATIQFAAAVRRRLDQSQDADMLAQIGSRLMHFRFADAESATTGEVVSRPRVGASAEHNRSRP
jgi:hypothetical protein